MICVITLFQLGRPTVLKEAPGGQATRPGGTLAQIKEGANLAEVQLGEIDPAGSAIKLATLGLRGVAISLLWYQSQEFEKKKDWNNVIATSNQIIRLEPHFITIWEFLGWRLAYNASAEFDDYRERYRWVILGFDFIDEGTKYNRSSPILFQKAGWTISQKIGIADEKEQYRRLLREDDDFHTRHQTPTLRDRDNWLLGRKWYHQGEKLVDQGGDIGKQSEQLYYQNSRKNLIHYADWLALDGRKNPNDDITAEIKAAWLEAEKEWDEFGGMKFKTAIPRRDDPDKIWETTLLEFVALDKEEKELVEKLKALEPGLYDKKVLDNWEKLLEFTNGEEQQAILVDWIEKSHDAEAEIIKKHLDETMPDWKEKFAAITEDVKRKLLKPEYQHLLDVPRLLVDEQDKQILSRMSNEFSLLSSKSISGVKIDPKMLVDFIEDKELKKEANDIRERLVTIALDKHMSDLFRGILNYDHWTRKIDVEQQDEVIEGRRSLFEARKVYREGDQSGANRIWLAAMKCWEDLIGKPGFEDIGKDAQFARDILDLAVRYVIILDAEDRLFPETFPLQQYIRERLEYDGELKEVRPALEYAENLYKKGDYENATEALVKIARVYAGINSGVEYMKLAPLPEVRDETLKVAALYVDCLRKRGLKLQPGFPLQGYVDLMLKKDNLVNETLAITSKAITESNSEKYGEAQETFNQAFAKWNEVLQKYPIIYLEPESSYYGDIYDAVRVYEKTLENQGKSIPEDFELKEFLK
ncbi:MAG: hypothetical protein ACRC2T_12925 [Thermoguttaceae bacterium]